MTAAAERADGVTVADFVLAPVVDDERTIQVQPRAVVGLEVELVVT